MPPLKKLRKKVIQIGKALSQGNSVGRGETLQPQGAAVTGSRGGKAGKPRKRGAKIADALKAGNRAGRGRAPVQIADAQGQPAVGSAAVQRPLVQSQNLAPPGVPQENLFKPVEQPGQVQIADAAAPIAGTQAAVPERLGPIQKFRQAFKTPEGRSSLFDLAGAIGAASGTDSGRATAAFAKQKRDEIEQRRVQEANQRASEAKFQLDQEKFKASEEAKASEESRRAAEETRKEALFKRGDLRTTRQGGAFLLKPDGTKEVVQEPFADPDKYSIQTDPSTGNLIAVNTTNPAKGSVQITEGGKKPTITDIRNSFDLARDKFKTDITRKFAEKFKEGFPPGAQAALGTLTAPGGAVLNFNTSGGGDTGLPLEFKSFGLGGNIEAALAFLDVADQKEIRREFALLTDQLLGDNPQEAFIAAMQREFLGGGEPAQDETDGPRLEVIDTPDRGRSQEVVRYVQDPVTGQLVRATNGP